MTLSHSPLDTHRGCISLPLGPLDVWSVGIIAVLWLFAAGASTALAHCDDAVVLLVGVHALIVLQEGGSAAQLRVEALTAEQQQQQTRAAAVSGVVLCVLVSGCWCCCCCCEHEECLGRAWEPCAASEPAKTLSVIFYCV